MTFCILWSIWLVPKKGSFPKYFLWRFHWWFLVNIGWRENCMGKRKNIRGCRKKFIKPLWWPAASINFSSVPLNMLFSVTRLENCSISYSFHRLWWGQGSWWRGRHLEKAEWSEFVSEPSSTIPQYFLREPHCLISNSKQLHCSGCETFAWISVLCHGLLWGLSLRLSEPRCNRG